MNKRGKEIILLATFLIGGCWAGTSILGNRKEAALDQAPLSTPTNTDLLPSETPTVTTALSTPQATSRDIYYPEVGLTYRRIVYGNLECSIVPPQGTMWRAAYSLGNEYQMGDVDEIQLHAITNEGLQAPITYRPNMESFPRPSFQWEYIHANSMACRALAPLAP